LGMNPFVEIVSYRSTRSVFDSEPFTSDRSGFIPVDGHRRVGSHLVDSPSRLGVWGRGGV
jgi:hypothetical protein